MLKLTPKVELNPKLFKIWSANFGENNLNFFGNLKTKNITFVSPNANGIVAERLGSGLQNRVQRFESARYLPVGERIGN